MATPFDIQKLRQQALMGGFNPTPDIMGGMDIMPPAMPRQLPNEPTFPGGGMQGPPVMSPPSTPPTDSQSDIMALINQAYSPETTSRDRFNRLLDTMPERNDPGIARRIVAGGMGIGSKDPMATMEGAMYAPYLRDMAAFKEKAGPFQQAAQLENTANINERQLTGNALVADAAQKRIASQQQIAEEKNRIAEIRAIAETAKANRWTVKIDGPNVLAISPDGTQVRTIGSASGMTQEDKINLEGQWRVDAAAARGDAAVSNTQTTGRGLIQVGGITYERDPDTGEWVPARGIPQGTATRPSAPSASGAGAKPNTLEQMRQEQQTLKEWFELDETARKWIEKGQDGKFRMKNRPVLGSGKTMGYFGEGVTAETIAEYDAIRKEIYPGYVPKSVMDQAGMEGAGTQASGTNAPTATSGRGVGAGSQPAAGLGGRASGAGAAKGGTRTPLQQKAAEFLEKNGKPVTPANIEHAIKQGWVK